MATRLYFRESGTAPVSPSFDSAWNRTSDAARIPMFRTTSGADTLTTVTGFAGQAGTTNLHRQLIGEKMAAGNVFDTGETYKCYLQTRESAASDDIVSAAVLKIVSEDGTTVQHTILSGSDYSTGSEWHTSLRNKAFIDGDAGSGSYTTVEGDRLLLEIGHQYGGGGTGSSSSRWGSSGGSDLPENETSTNTALNPWFETSLDIAFQSEGAATVEGAPIGDFAVEWWLYDATSASKLQVWPISANAGHDGLMNGTAVLLFPADDPAVDTFLGATLGQEFPEVTLRMFLRGVLRWIGPVELTTLRSVGDVRSGMVEVTCRHMWEHVHRRRAIYGGASVDEADKTDAADNILRDLQRENIAGSLVTPSSYPGGHSRDDFGSFGFTVQADASAAASTRLVQQGGTNLLTDGANYLVENHDLRPQFSVDDDDSNFSLDCTSPFQRDDKTDTVIFSQARGNLPKFELVSDRTALANMWLVEGDGTSTQSWVDDSTSIGLWGVFEAFAQKPQDNAMSSKAADAGNVAQRLSDRWGGAEVAYKAELAEITGMLLGNDWWWADLIAIDEWVYGIQTDQVITGWKVSQSEGRVHRVDLFAGPPRERNQSRREAEFAGVDGPVHGGNFWRNRRQS